jgi:site-specific DNA-methyltransferase (adenine-specific)
VTSRPRCLVCRNPVSVRSRGRRRRYCSDACRMAAHRRRHRRLRGSREVMGSSRTDEWATDPEVFARLEREFGPFDLDPCATHENAKCSNHFTREVDGLSQEWTGRVFMNPPYGRALPAWMRKACEAAQNGSEIVVCLVPARTDTRWWHDYATRGEITFLQGRLRSGEGCNPWPFPSVVVVFRNAQTVTKSATEALA